jgi:hypothetical protein
MKNDEALTSQVNEFYDYICWEKDGLDKKVLVPTRGVSHFCS